LYKTNILSRAFLIIENFPQNVPVWELSSSCTRTCTNTGSGQLFRWRDFTHRTNIQTNYRKQQKSRTVDIHKYIYESIMNNIYLIWKEYT